MPNILTSAAAFLKRERGYRLLFIFVVVFYAAAAFNAHRHEPEKRDQQAFEKYEEAEKQLQQQVRDPQAVLEFMRTHPRLVRVFGGFLGVVALFFFTGMVLNGLHIFSPAWRRGIAADWIPQEKTQWTFSLLAKMILLFLTFAVILSMGFELVKVMLPVKLSENFYLILHTTFVDIGVLVLMIFVLHREKGDWKDLGFWRPRNGWLPECLAGWGGYAAVLPLFTFCLIFLAVLAEIFSYEPPPHPLVHVLLEEERRSPWLVAYSVLLATCVGPILEELFFRGFCYRIFKNRMGIVWGTLLSAGLFAWIHESSFAFWPIFILGIGLTRLYEKRKSIVAPVVLHMTHNTVFMTYFYLAKHVIQAATM